MDAAPKFLTIGEVALALRVHAWTISRLIGRGKLSPLLAGRVRIFKRDELPNVRRALVEAGYLKPGRHRRHKGRRTAAAGR